MIRPNEGVSSDKRKEKKKEEAAGKGRLYEILLEDVYCTRGQCNGRTLLEGRRGEVVTVVKKGRIDQKGWLI